MKQRSALLAAREQIVWILALIGSTALVVHLERLDLQAVGSGLSQNPFAAAENNLPALRAQVAALATEPGDLALAQRATALAMALMMAPMDAPLRAEAQALLTTAQDRLPTSQEPLLAPGLALLATTLSAQP